MRWSKNKVFIQQSRHKHSRTLALISPPPEGLGKVQNAGLHPQPWKHRFWRDPRICILNKLPGDTEAPDWKPRFEDIWEETETQTFIWNLWIFGRKKISTHNMKFSQEMQLSPLYRWRCSVRVSVTCYGYTMEPRSVSSHQKTIREKIKRLVFRKKEGSSG